MAIENGTIMSRISRGREGIGRLYYRIIRLTMSMNGILRHAAMSIKLPANRFMIVSTRSDSLIRRQKKSNGIGTRWVCPTKSRSFCLRRRRKNGRNGCDFCLKKISRHLSKNEDIENRQERENRKILSLKEIWGVYFAYFASFYDFCSDRKKN